MGVEVGDEGHQLGNQGVEDRILLFTFKRGSRKYLL
jgi:hypothetical protein